MVYFETVSCVVDKHNIRVSLWFTREGNAVNLAKKKNIAIEKALGGDKSKHGEYPYRAVSFRLTRESEAGYTAPSVFDKTGANTLATK